MENEGVRGNFSLTKRELLFARLAEAN
jgi:hypothetical protein